MNAIPEIDLRRSYNGDCMNDGPMSGGKTMPAAIYSMGSSAMKKQNKFKTVESQAKEVLLQIAAQQQALMTNPHSFIGGIEEPVNGKRLELLTGNVSPSKAY